MKRTFTTAAIVAALAAFYLLSYRFSGVTISPTNPSAASLTVFGIPLPATPGVCSAYNVFYWPLRVQTAKQKPPKTIIGTIQHLDFSERRLSVAPSSGPTIGCTFPPADEAMLQNFKRGDMVTASIGYVPDPQYPSSWRYTLLSITPHQ